LKNPDTSLGAGKRRLGIVFGILLCLAAMVGQGAGQKAPEVQTAPAPKVSVAIPVAEVATRATEVSNLLRTLQTQFAPSPEIEKIQKELPDVRDRLEAKLRRTMKLLQAQPMMETLQTEEQVWQKSQTEMGKWMSLLTQRATQLQTALGRLADLQKAWSQTLDSARSEQAREAIVQQITAILPAIEAAQITLQTQRSAVLDLQGPVAAEIAKCGTALAEIAKAQRMAVGGFADRERLPIWSAERWAQARAAGFSSLREFAADPWAEIVQYLHDPSSGMPIHLGFLVALSVMFYAMRREVRRWAPGEGSPVITLVSERPYAAALIASLLIASSPTSPAPPTMRNLFEVLAMAPIIRLMKPAVDQRLVFGLYALAVLFTLDMVRHALAGAILFDQVMVVLEAIAGMAVLGWSLAYGNLRGSLTEATGLARLRAHRVGARVVLFALGLGLVAGVLGYMHGARLLVSCVLIGGALALALFASVKILCAVAGFGLRVWPLRLLHMVRDHRDLQERRTRRVLVFLAIVAWLVRVLDYVGLLEPTLSFGKTLLAVKLERGSISVSVEDVLAFVLTVWVAYLFSAFIRFVLQEDVYPRTKVPQGMAYAASRLLHYVILALGFVVGVGVLGVDLTKVTVLVGAFGVGLGFGLQSVVNNFVSGLILLFERPIHVGDTVEAGNIQGQVQRIGIRSSIVRTGQGAEIIVPNSQLVSEQVTNWTLSDQLRRIDLTVRMDYSAPPQKVIEVIEAVANAHPMVLKNPKPQVLFVGFGDNSINFELRAWTDQFTDWGRTKSELTVAVYDAVQAAGMAFPLSQHKVRLLHDDKA
jgi:small-conductance mechanosensitive channel